MVDEQYKCPKCGMRFKLYKDYIEHMACYVDKKENKNESNR